jgi:hypothetical protein
MQNFSSNSLALVLASTSFNASDYVRSYTDYLQFNYTTKVHRCIRMLMLHYKT